MARTGRNTGAAVGAVEVTDYRHDEKRKNIPPAKIAAEGRVPPVPKISYSLCFSIEPGPHPDSVSRA